MSRLKQAPRVDLNVIVQLNEAEIRALDALVGYGIKPFLEVFYAHLGQHYMKPHEAGLRSLFDTINADLRPILDRMDSARKAFVLNRPVIHSREHHDELIAQVRAAAAAQALKEQS